MAVELGYGCFGRHQQSTVTQLCPHRTFAPVWEQLTNSTLQVSQLHTAQGKELQEIAKGVALDSADAQWVKQVRLDAHSRFAGLNE